VAISITNVSRRDASTRFIVVGNNKIRIFHVTHRRLRSYLKRLVNLGFVTELTKRECMKYLKKGDIELSVPCLFPRRDCGYCIVPLHEFVFEVVNVYKRKRYDLVRVTKGCIRMEGEGERGEVPDFEVHGEVTIGEETAIERGPDARLGWM